MLFWAFFGGRKKSLKRSQSIENPRCRSSNLVCFLFYLVFLQKYNGKMTCPLLSPPGTMAAMTTQAARTPRRNTENFWFPRVMFIVVRFGSWGCWLNKQWTLLHRIKSPLFCILHTLSNCRRQLGLFEIGTRDVFDLAGLVYFPPKFIYRICLQYCANSRGKR